MAEERLRIRRCPKCANSCPLDKPKCSTGAAIAERDGVWEAIPPVEEKVSLFRRIFRGETKPH